MSMHSIIYDDDTRGPPQPMKILQMDPVPRYLTHYGNLLFLEFVRDNPKSTLLERRRAEKEIVVAQRKIAFWQRHPDWNATRAANGVEKLKKQWGKG